MCPHGYHHNGFMATPALGTQEVRYYNYYIFVSQFKKINHRLELKFSTSSISALQITLEITTG